MAIAPTAAAMTVFISLTVSQLRLFSAISGRQACPSWEMQLASSTGNGRIPAANIDTKTRCGPDSGISPAATAITSISQMFPLIQVSMSI